jgi:hypothetical protein
MKYDPDMYLMDESDVPYKEGEYNWTRKDDMALLDVVVRDGLELKPDSDLYRLGKELGVL